MPFPKEFGSNPPDTPSECEYRDERRRSEHPQRHRDRNEKWVERYCKYPGEKKPNRSTRIVFDWLNTFRTALPVLGSSGLVSTFRFMWYVHIQHQDEDTLLSPVNYFAVRADARVPQ